MTYLGTSVRNILTSTIWLVTTPILGAGLVMSLFIRRYTLARTTVKNPGKDKGAEKGDVEKGPEVTPGGSESGDVHEGEEVPKQEDGEGTVRGGGSLDKSGVKETV
ncbi:hypothetical protein B0H19DRAFT_1243653 [Mycena capillaripes]|nr:hypothetical protein B0H19DRAFT_1243653 [Mycena capillaripes]